jgi:hypothetical protein
MDYATLVGMFGFCLFALCGLALLGNALFHRLRDPRVYVMPVMLLCGAVLIALFH